MIESSHFKPPIWQQCQHNGAPAPKWSDIEADNEATNEDQKANNEALYQHIYILVLRLIINSSNLTHQVPLQPPEPELHMGSTKAAILSHLQCCIYVVWMYSFSIWIRYSVFRLVANKKLTRGLWDLNLQVRGWMTSLSLGKVGVLFRLWPLSVLQVLNCVWRVVLGAGAHFLMIFGWITSLLVW